ncbi:MAG: type II toxin-antitoxin system HicA family toxin [Chloroflexi bacterium]|nr:type II toxin-antitoxin system HicA family toxin [Chloroflexota bacterium]
MSRLPTLSAQELIRALRKAGFQVSRQRGSHVMLRHADGRRTAVPVHRGEDLGRGIMSAILSETGISRRQLVELLRDP